MYGKSLVLVFVLFCLPCIASDKTELGSISEKLDNIENLIFAAELETSFCQKHSAWNFPSQLYHYLGLAKQYGDNLEKGRNTKKFQENLQNILIAVEECIDDKNDCCPGGLGDLWNASLPSIPDCALEAFEKMRIELEIQIIALNNISN